MLLTYLAIIKTTFISVGTCLLMTSSYPPIYITRLVIGCVSKKVLHSWLIADLVVRVTDTFKKFCTDHHYKNVSLVHTCYNTVMLLAVSVTPSNLFVIHVAATASSNLFDKAYAKFVVQASFAKEKFNKTTSQVRNILNRFTYINRNYIKLHDKSFNDWNIVITS